MKRYEININYEGTNGNKQITSYGNDLYQCLENLTGEIENFESEYLNNNMNTGGATAFTQDAEVVFVDIIKEARADVDRLLR